MTDGGSHSSARAKSPQKPIAARRNAPLDLKSASTGTVRPCAYSCSCSRRPAPAVRAGLASVSAIRAARWGGCARCSRSSAARWWRISARERASSRSPWRRRWTTSSQRRSTERLRRLREAVVAAKLDNVTVLEAYASDTGLPPNCCDAIVLRRVYHHLTDPSGLNAGLLRALRPGGVLAVVDFPPPFFLGRGRFGVPAESVTTGEGRRIRARAPHR